MVPVEVKLHTKSAVLEVIYSSGDSFLLSAEYLRVYSPSAEVQGHGPGQKNIVAGRRHVSILKIEPVGHYAIRLIFDDLHDTGIFSWSYLLELGANMSTRWDTYLAELNTKGLSRDP